MLQPLTGILFTFLSHAAAQPIPSVLNVEVENYVAYLNDTSDPARVARSATPVTPTVPLNFYTNVVLADVVRINGTSVKGTLVVRAQSLGLSPTPTPGGAIADSPRQTIADLSFEFLKADGAQIGNLYSMGFSGGTPPPGSPDGATAGASAIIGGTGIFAGARGVISNVEVVSPRATSQAEDPSRRRTNGGGRARFAVQIFPLVQPEIVTTSTGPQVFHADATPVTSETPAKPGEQLYLHAAGLGPTLPAVNLGDPFPDTDSTVVAPVEVWVNDTPTPATSAIGLRGATGVYRVQFRLPESAPAAATTLQVGVAWIKGPRTPISLQ